jgi:hypothetical protein
MPGKLSKVLNLISNMGWRYISYRVRHELLKRAGLLNRKFPTYPAFKQYTTLSAWKQQKTVFFFADKEQLKFAKRPTPELKTIFTNIKNGKLMLFNSQLTDLGKDFDWATNPDSGFHYNVHKHWTEIADYSEEAGDIKYVWEKSRFSYIYDVIRYDYHHGDDCAAFVFSEIISWIKANPVNSGPNYRCSQEMSLRVLNWTFALHYYRNSAALTEAVFDQVQYAIYWHLHHIYNNIDFSRIAVRNNHAITETLTLYLAGLLYPDMPGAATWKAKGKKWFEEEIAYQVYEDGTFLQFSMNYHRIVAQLLTWGIRLSELNGERFSSVVYERAKKSLVFLRTCMVDENGWLPNYGANDGALFFKLNNEHFRNYQPVLQALGHVLGIDTGFDTAYEDSAWYGIDNIAATTLWQPANGPHRFEKGGYYVIREPETLTFIRCGNHKDRPSQADNLHLDLWYKGENILPDAGSYKYNTDKQTMRYFSGTQSHNTVMLDDNDQMLKGGRFIWYYWTQCIEALLTESEDNYSFNGAISAFTYISDGIHHKRTVIKQKGVPHWKITDEIEHLPGSMKMKQLWHLPHNPKNKIIILPGDHNNPQMNPVIRDGWYSSLYGQKEKTQELSFSAAGNTITTVISIENS